ncbi:OB-fold nucleic acid binding domain-containing protein [Nocardioides bruguierae]|uniref:OB-fold nucleic acid binding domain-containing protein n=1 Tax=Nocardioides bruguierae TaxID=2945102 RepID=A0A9X2IDA3_9ACTN|nr:OB-fold nucleic acid binding domain-containing protein [Nocardioides bruguierae]MCL8024351.1 OB-fold nucleic acid binding domain-containing protein [Nocardioides bruguierae]MCM0618818.1 OB-fold nucleic acid binding domain-containing protein [Nocardioides bruguierae]
MPEIRGLRRGRAKKNAAPAESPALKLDPGAVPPAPDTMPMPVLRVGTSTIAAAPDRDLVRVRGTVRDVRRVQIGDGPALEADLCDETGSVVLVWLGRDRITGLETGVCLAAEGRIARHDGRRVLYHPRYELVPQACG